jgi:nucleoside-diphosphate-sugar epimerase
MKFTNIELKEFEKYLAIFDFSSITGKNFLFTGSGGMTSKCLIKFLCFANEKKELGIQIFASTRHPEIKFSYLEANDPVKLIKFGIEDECLSNERVDFIINAAAPTGRPFFVSFPVETFRTIVDENEKMLDLAVKKKVSSFVYLSSVEVYGTPTKDMSITEDYFGPINQMSIRSGYPIGKKGSEFLSLAYFKEYGVPVKIVRPSSIQGLFQPYDEDRVYNQILRCILENKNFVLNTDGSTKKTIVYTLDCALGILLVLLKGTSGETYNITNPSTFMSVKDMAEMLFSKFNPNIKIEYKNISNVKAGYLPKVCFNQNISKIMKLGWNPLGSLEHIYSVDIERFTNYENERG